MIFTANLRDFFKDDILETNLGNNTTCAKIQRNQQCSIFNFMILEHYITSFKKRKCFILLYNESLIAIGVNFKNTLYIIP